MGKVNNKTNKGHRKRLRKKFLNSGLAGFLDYEIIELLLTIGTPRRDCKQTAKAALKKFKTLRGVLEASDDKLKEIKGIGPKNIFGIKIVQAVSRRFLKEKAMEKPIMNSSGAVYDYLYHSMRDLKKEIFKVMFLNMKNEIIEIENLFEGTINMSSVYTREVIKKAIYFDAARLILVHNHPSGNPEPSQSDIDITKKLIKACETMDIRILDHIIVGDNQYYSFTNEGIMNNR